MYSLSLSFVLDISVLFYVERFPSCSPLPIGFLYLSRVRRKRRWDRLFPGYLFPSFSEIFFWSIGFHVFSWPFCYSFPYVITFSFSLRIKLNEHSQCVDIIWSTLFSGWMFDSFVTSEAQEGHAKKTRGANWTLCMKLTCSDDYRGARVLTGQMYVACLVRYRELRTECL